MAEFDTFLIGRRTFEMMAKQGMTAEPAGATYIVCSRTMREADWPGLHISRDAATTVAGLKASSGRDIAVFGGGDLFRSLLAAGLVDRVEVSVVPVLLGGGVPLLPSPADRARLKLRSHRLYGTTGTMRLEYDILPASPA
jgi:dihydrofolate reductase